jgi:hypothetical protein
MFRANNAILIVPIVKTASTAGSQSSQICFLPMTRSPLYRVSTARLCNLYATHSAYSTQEAVFFGAGGVISGWVRSDRHRLSSITVDWALSLVPPSSLGLTRPTKRHS